jgi:hypothetical protein
MTPGMTSRASCRALPVLSSRPSRDRDTARATLGSKALLFRRFRGKCPFSLVHSSRFRTPPLVISDGRISRVRLATVTVPLPSSLCRRGLSAHSHTPTHGGVPAHIADAEPGVAAHPSTRHDREPLRTLQALPVGTGLWRLLDGLSRTERPTLLRGDAGGGNEPVVREAEQRGQPSGSPQCQPARCGAPSSPGPGGRSALDLSVLKSHTRQHRSCDQLGLNLTRSERTRHEMAHNSGARSCDPSRLCRRHTVRDWASPITKAFHRRGLQKRRSCGLEC